MFRERAKARVSRPSCSGLALALAVFVLGALVAGVGACNGHAAAGGDRAKAASPPTGRDSIDSIREGWATVRPVARVAAPRIDELSGLCWQGGAWFAHNDSGDDPILYRSTRLDFRDAEELPIDGAKAKDWEDITLFEGDLLVADTGDNQRKRQKPKLYRVRYHPAKKAGGAGRAELVATYPFDYPDGKHDAEALFVVAGRVHIVTKARHEKETGVYRFDTLQPEAKLPKGGVNVPARIGTLEIGAGEMVTAGDTSLDGKSVVLLTYGQLLRYPSGKLAGKPEAELLLALQQCEAVCVRPGRVVIANEQREVYAVDRVWARGLRGLVRPNDRAVLPILCAKNAEADGTGKALGDAATALRLYHAGPKETLRWGLVGDRMHVHCNLEVRRPDGPRPMAADQLGSALVLGFGTRRTRRPGKGTHELALGVDERGGVGLWRAETAAGKHRWVRERGAAGAVGTVTKGRIEAEVVLPLRELFGDTKPPVRFLFAALGNDLRGPSEDEVRFGLPTAYGFFRPFTWAEVKVER